MKYALKQFSNFLGYAIKTILIPDNKEPRSKKWRITNAWNELRTRTHWRIKEAIAAAIPFELKLYDAEYKTMKTSFECYAKENSELRALIEELRKIKEK